MPKDAYQQTLDYIYRQLPMFSRVGGKALKKGLNNISALCRALGNPQNLFPSIHIAGTNGKGSVAHLLSAAFQNAGYKAGLYTSPHLVDFRERFRINGKLIEKDFIVAFIEENKAIIEGIRPSYFEITVALAFSAFAQKKVDIAIIEVGLGGRLDSTNIICPELSVITHIGFDHTEILGDTLAKIAAEKAGIIKEKTPILIGEKQKETTPVFERVAKEKNAPLFFAQDNFEIFPLWEVADGQKFKVKELNANRQFTFCTDLKGYYQQFNLRTAIAASAILYKQGWNLPLKDVLQSFSRIKEITQLHGRWEVVQQTPKIILEVAHNEGSIKNIKENLALEQKTSPGKIYILIGFVRDKDLTRILPLLPKEADYYFTKAEVPRALDTAVLYEKAVKAGLRGVAVSTIAQAVGQAISQLKRQDLLLITGSFFVVGEAITALKNLGK